MNIGLRCFLFPWLLLFSSNESEQKCKNYSAENGNDDRVDHSSLTGKSESAHDETTDNRTHNTDDDVHESAITAALHQFACDPAGNQADDDPPKNEHAKKLP